MCQLIYISSTNQTLQKLLLYLSLKNDTIVGNKDGFGILYPDSNTIVKSPNEFESVDTSQTFRDFTRGRSVIAHARAAFSGINGKKIGVEFNHPFEGKHFIFAHNGVLAYKDKTKVSPIDKIDTQIFLDEFESAYEKEQDVAKALTSAMDLFHGKFAFLFKDKNTNNYYAARGKTALLHICTLYNDKDNILAYIINTDRLCLETTIHDIIVQYSILGVTLKPSKIELLAEETIFRLDSKELNILGPIKETEAPTRTVYAGTYYHNGVYTAYEDYDGYDVADYTNKAITSGVVSPSKEFNDLLASNMIRWKDVMAITLLLNNKSILEMRDPEIRALIDLVKELTKCNSKKKKALWRKMSQQFYEDDLYEMEEMSFPYFLTPISELHQIKREAYANTEL
jgi:predicted glutamine amidotransferase